MVLKRKRVRPLKDKPLGEGRTTRSKHPERKTTPEAKPESDDGWEAVKILAETKKRHLVSWAPGVERSGKIKIYKPSWVSYVGWLTHPASGVCTSATVEAKLVVTRLIALC